MAAIEAAHFVGKADRSRVTDLLTDFSSIIGEGLSEWSAARVVHADKAETVGEATVVVGAAKAEEAGEAEEAPGLVRCLHLTTL